MSRLGESIGDDVDRRRVVAQPTVATENLDVLTAGQGTVEAIKPDGSTNKAATNLTSHLRVLRTWVVESQNDKHILRRR